LGPAILKLSRKSLSRSKGSGNPNIKKWHIHPTDWANLKVLSKIKCTICPDAIQDGNRTSINLLDIKNRWTKKPSKDVISLCKIGELIFKIHRQTSSK